MTIGILLCKEKNNAVVKMTLLEDNAQIFASKYETVLPSKEALQELLREQEYTELLRSVFIIHGRLVELFVAGQCKHVL